MPVFRLGDKTYRYGPNTNDPRAIHLSRKINSTMENQTDFPGDAFRFTLDERFSLGAAVVRRVGGTFSVHPEFESIPLYVFTEELNDRQSKHAALYQSKAVRASMAAIDRADRPESLEGHERLAVLQNLLVDLVAYLEEKEGFRIALGERRKVRVAGAYAAGSEGHTAIARILHQTRGRIRLGIPRIRKDAAYARRVKKLLESVEHVTEIRINAAAASVVVSHSTDLPMAEFAARELQKIEGASASWTPEQ